MILSPQSSLDDSLDKSPNNSIQAQLAATEEVLSMRRPTRWLEMAKVAAKTRVSCAVLESGNIPPRRTTGCILLRTTAQRASQAENVFHVCTREYMSLTTQESVLKSLVSPSVCR
jgi:hypothetical protein